MIDNSEKKYIYAVISVVVIVLIGVIILIWTPTSDVIKDKLTLCDVVGDYDTIQIENYNNIVNKLLLMKNYDLLFEKIDETWLKSNNYTKETLYTWLFENFIISNNEPNIIESTAVAAEDSYYFRYKIQTSTNEEKYLIINETIPNNYTISFEQDTISKLNGKTYLYGKDGIEYKINVVTILDNLLQYEISVTNEGEKTYYYNLNTNDSIVLNLSDGTNIIPADITTLANNEYVLPKDGSFSVKVTFNININKQNLIESLTFNNAFDNDSKIDLKIVLKEGGE